jgi:hypothetical protein
MLREPMPEGSLAYYFGDGDVPRDVRPTNGNINTYLSSAISRKQNAIAFSKGSWYLASP